MCVRLACGPENERSLLTDTRGREIVIDRRSDLCSGRPLTNDPTLSLWWGGEAGPTEIEVGSRLYRRLAGDAAL